MKANEVEIVWAAGFFDGEGSVYVNNYNSIGLQANQVHKSTLERFHRAVGVGKIRPASGMRRGLPMWSWRTDSREHFKVVVNLLWPYLCDPTKEKILRNLKKRRDRRMRVSEDGQDSWCPEACQIEAESSTESFLDERCATAYNASSD